MMNMYLLLAKYTKRDKVFFIIRENIFIYHTNRRNKMSNMQMHDTLLGIFSKLSEENIASLKEKSKLLDKECFDKADIIE